MPIGPHLCSCNESPSEMHPSPMLLPVTSQPKGLQVACLYSEFQAECVGCLVP